MIQGCSFPFCSFTLCSILSNTPPTRSLPHLAQRLRNLHQTLPARRSPPPLGAETQPALPALSPIADVPTPTHEEAGFADVYNASRHALAAAESGFGDYSEEHAACRGGRGRGRGRGRFGDVAVDIDDIERFCEEHTAGDRGGGE